MLIVSQDRTWVANVENIVEITIEDRGVYVKDVNRELWGWCDCGKAIEGRWVGLANFCPWCGRVIEWERDE